MKIEVNKFFNNTKTNVKSIFRSLQYKNYRYYFYGQSLSLIGTWIQKIATPWLVYSLTGSPFLLGVVGFAGQIPTFVLAPFAGVLVDRWDRYKILIISQVLSMIQALTLAYLVITNQIEVWQIITLSVTLGIINALEVPSRQSFVVDLIEKREDLGNAIALNSSMVTSARLLGPSIAGVLIAFAGEGTCFLLNGISYIFVLVFLLLMKIKPKPKTPNNTNVIKGFKEGYSYTFGFLPIRYLILLLALVSLVGMPYIVLMPIFAKNILNGGSHTFGFLMGASGLGALMGSFYMASRKNVLGLIRRIPLFSVIFGLGLIAFSFSRIFMLSLILIPIAGLGMVLQMTSSNTILQTIVDDDKRGRVMSFYSMAFFGAAPFGSLISGALATKIGAPNTLLLGGVSCIIGAVIFARKLPEIRKLIHEVYVKKGILKEE